MHSDTLKGVASRQRAGSRPYIPFPIQYMYKHV